MDLLAQAAEGFRSVEVAPEVKQQALKNLEQWLTDPAFAAYRPQLEWLIAERQWAGLVDRFYQILPFGTGGRRGPVGIGPNRMNLWTVGASVQGHCEYLKQRLQKLARLDVVLAYDVRCFRDKNRRYNPDLPNPVLGLSSRDLAVAAACIYAANGVHVHILPDGDPRFLATPELSYFIRLLKAHGGLNVSASHNPPDDNGGKFYDEYGGQPVPPNDQHMADLVDKVVEIKTVPWSEAVKSGHVHFLNDGPHKAYINLCVEQALTTPPKADEITVVFTPLHGVGSMTALEALQARGFKVVTVAEQMAPDGMFPNVTKSPNPEVPESMDRAAALAKTCRADIVLSTDPDADRIGALIPKPDGDYRFVSGNEIAVLLTHFKLAQWAEQGKLTPKSIVVKTTVTTRMIERVAEHFKVQIVGDLLVGFKYHADVIHHLDRDGAYGTVRGTPADFVIGSEESHGILVTPEIRDKDAGAAALNLAELALVQKRQGKTVLTYLESLYRQFGYHRTEGVNLVMTGVEGKTDMIRMLDGLRATPPKEIAGLAVTRTEDLRDPKGRMGPIKSGTDAASRNVLVYTLGDRAQVVLRPSGTEPKAKIYIEAWSAPCPADVPEAQWRQTCAEIDTLVKRLGDDFQKKALALVGK